MFFYLSSYLQMKDGTQETVEEEAEAEYDWRQRDRLSPSRPFFISYSGTTPGLLLHQKSRCILLALLYNLGRY
jgi:hypothetical protein